MKKIVIGICVYLAVGTANANEIAVVEKAENYANQNGTGFAPELFQAIKNVGDLNLDLAVYPLERAIHMFEKKKCACYLGGDEQAAMDYLKIKVISSELFLESKVYAYTLRTKPKINDLKMLHGKKIGSPRGLKSSILYLNDIKPKFEYANTTAQNLKKLKYGRIDVLIAYHIYLSPKMLSQVHYDPKIVLYSAGETLVCHPENKNQSYIKQFNKGLRIVKENGTYQKIYDKYFRLNPK